jgi:hypothetical protein
MCIHRVDHVTDICRRLGISQQSCHRWQTKYGGMDPKMAKQLQELSATSCSTVRCCRACLGLEAFREHRAPPTRPQRTARL